MVITRHAVTQSGKPLLHPLNDNPIGETITKVLQLLVCCRRRNKQTTTISHSKIAHQTNASNRRVDDRNVIGELGL